MPKQTHSAMNSHKQRTENNLALLFTLTYPLPAIHWFRCKKNIQSVGSLVPTPVWLRLLFWFVLPFC